jgi:hypothetical protein
MAMSRIAQDTFQRTNQSGFGTASDGQTWTMTGTGTLSIASNEGLVVSSASDSHIQLGTHVGTDMIALCRIAVSNASDICGVQTRFTSSGGQTTAYKFLWYASAVHLNKAISGVNTQMTTQSFSVTASTFYWFKLATIGTNQYGKIWQDGTAEPGAWTTTFNDTSVTSGGVAILANTAGTGVQFDNFSALPFVSPVRAPSRSMRRFA